MRKKILITAFTFSPNKDGVAEAAGAMARGFAARDYEVVVVTGQLAARQDVQPHPRLRVAQFDVDWDWRVAGRSREEATRMQQFILDEAPDLVICHCWEIWSTAVTENIFARLRAKKILVSHGYSNLWRPHRKFPWGLGVLLRSLRQVAKLPRTFKLYDRIVFLSQRSDWRRFLDYKLARLARYNGIRIIPNGTDADPERSSCAEFRQGCDATDRFLVLCVANYLPGKNQALTLTVFRKARLSDATLVFIGSAYNEYSASLMALDEKLRADYPEGRVVFLQQLDRRDTMAAYAACDLFLFTSKSEVAPIVILEAMAAGKPFLSTHVGCVSEFPGGVVVNGQAKLTATLVALRNNPVRCHALGAAGRRAVLEEFSKEKTQAAQEQMIRELLDAS